MSYGTMFTSLAAATALATAVAYTYEEVDTQGREIVAQYQQVMSDYYGTVDRIIAALGEEDAE